MSNENEVTTKEQVDALPAGTWVIAADGTQACLFDTHIGFPQRMWGLKPKGGPVGSFVAITGLTLPLHLADIDEPEGYTCPHPRPNECGQCQRCGKPGVGKRREWFFDEQGMETFRMAAEANAKAAS
jgi:hypothetical protein